MKVFLSYTRADAEVMEVLAGDIRQLAHTVWYDREVAGGQAWWSAILREIRESDLFVLILTSNSLDSEACRAEFTYASQLGKPILPLLCDAEVNVNLLPPELSQIQFVNCCAQDKQAAFGLFRALQALPKAGPPPEKLPAEPPVPISYLGGLQAQVDARDHELTLAEQSALFIQIKGGLNAADSRDGAMTLLRRLRDRQDLRAKIADEIDAILEQTQPPQEPERKRAPARKPASRKETGPPPEPLPAEPSAVDVSDRELALAVQSAQFNQIKEGLNAADSREKALTRLRRLRDRHDLDASVAAEIDAILEHKQPPQEPKRKRRPARKPFSKNESPPLEDHPAKQPPPEAPLPPDSAEATVDLTGTTEGLVALLEETAATSQAQVLKVGEDALWICVEDAALLLVAAFNRWADTEAKCLTAMGWEEAGKGMRKAAATALAVVGFATQGVGFGLLLHKKTRDYLFTHIALKRFPLSSTSEAARSIVEALRVLSPAATTAVASKSTGPHP